MRLRIAQIAPLWENIPPPFYGGTERILYSLTEGLVKKGHDVTIFANGESKTSAKLVAVYPRALFRDNYPWTSIMYPMLNITEAFDREKEFDIIHMHLNKASDFLALPLARHIKKKVVFTLHFPYPYQRKGYEDRAEVLQKYKDLQYISISNAARKGGGNLNWIATVYNGIPLEQFTFNPKPEDYWLWLGKFNPDKGVKQAILAAKKAGVKLLLAGAVDKLDENDASYWTQEIKPLIDDKQIIYVGEKGGKDKDEIFGKAIGFLNPIQWNEPFGLVMAESQATGTPVISIKNGAAPELIKNGETGYLVSTIDEMVQKMKEIGKIKRIKCRENIERHFTSNVMVDRYEEVYENVLKS